MKAETIQLFDVLPAHIEDALRESIRRFGVLVPVIQDQHGRTLDGHHRSRIAAEEGVDFAIDIVKVADDHEAREIARTLNADRRQLTPEQRQAVSVALRGNGHSLRAIAGAVGVSEKTIRSDLSTAEDYAVPERVVGLDGKSRPAERARPILTVEDAATLERVQSGTTAVVNLKSQMALVDAAEAAGLYVRIDRRTIWGNPFEMPDDGDRATVIRNYEKHYLPFKPSLQERLAELRGKVLGCWCAPEACHGDVLRQSVR